MSRLDGAAVPRLRRWLVPAVAVVQVLLLTDVAVLVHVNDVNDAHRTDAPKSIATDALTSVNCADPSMLETRDDSVVTEHLYCTDGSMPALSERSASSIAGLRDAAVQYVFTRDNMPRWAHGQYWAPEPRDLGNRAPSAEQRYLMLYCALDSTGVHGIGAALAPTADGPWTDTGIEQLSRPHTEVIDPALLQSHDGHLYLYWKETHHHGGPPTRIMAARVSIESTGLNLLTRPAEMIRADRSIEDGDVEAPSVVERKGRVILFYIGSGTTVPGYTVMAAAAESPLGPFHKVGQVLHKSLRWYGTGGATAVTLHGRDFLVFHGYPAGRYRDQRYPMLERVNYSGLAPVAGPGRTAEPIPHLDLELLGPSQVRTAGLGF